MKFNRAPQKPVSTIQRFQVVDSPLERNFAMTRRPSVREAVIKSATSTAFSDFMAVIQPAASAASAATDKSSKKHRKYKNNVALQANRLPASQAVLEWPWVGFLQVLWLGIFLRHAPTLCYQVLSPTHKTIAQSLYLAARAAKN